jgi:hypothetical protein
MNDTEPLVDLPHQERSRIGCDLGACKINEYELVKPGPNRIVFRFTIFEHGLDLK